MDMGDEVSEGNNRKWVDKKIESVANVLRKWGGVIKRSEDKMEKIVYLDYASYYLFILQG